MRLLILVLALSTGASALAQVKDPSVMMDDLITQTQREHDRDSSLRALRRDNERMRLELQNRQLQEQLADPDAAGSGAKCRVVGFVNGAAVTACD